jgi:membrane-bound lytic murein transglycosylase B
MLTGFTRFLRVATVALALTASGTVAADYSENARATAFVQKVVAKHGWDKAEITALLAQAQKQESVIKAIERPAESKSWAQYQDIFLIPKRIEGGVEFWNKHAKTLARAEQQFGVPAQIIVAILGVETLYGERMGTYRVIDTLVTQAFEFPADSWRARFGAEQLESLILLAKEQKFNPLELEGSYAGAMGYGQFIPTSYRAYAVDFDGDGIDDIWHNPVDAIGSIANYLKENGWRGGEDITVPAAVAAKADPAVVNRALKADSTITELEQKGYTATIKVQKQSAGVVELEGKNGQEFWLGLANYFVITTYNRSRLYAMAVYQLSEKIVSERNGDKS